MSVEVDVLVAQLGRALARHHGVELALLFGSYATGRAEPRSDIDLAVEAPGVDLLALAGRLSAELGLEVDVIDLTEATIPLLHQLCAARCAASVRRRFKEQRRPRAICSRSRCLGAGWRGRALRQSYLQRGSEPQRNRNVVHHWRQK